jgi:hypothetical protein
VKSPQVHKAKSAPFRHFGSKISMTDKPVRRAKTSENIPNKNKQQETNIEKKVMELSSLLQEEISRRRETEKINEELKRKLDEFNGIQVQIKPKANLSVIEDVARKENQDATPMEMLNKICRKNGVKKKNGVKNGVKINGYHEKNGYKLNGDVACTIFEKLVGNDGGDDESLDDESLLDYVQDEGKSVDDEGKLTNGYDMTDSQISLFKFMENLKNNNNLPLKFMNRPNTSKYYITDKHVKKKK